eukprot:11130743-Alexandrium_andersonii.AAC.1
MSASLVGSEMCIRDRCYVAKRGQATATVGQNRIAKLREEVERAQRREGLAFNLRRSAGELGWV